MLSVTGTQTTEGTETDPAKAEKVNFPFYSGNDK